MILASIAAHENHDIGLMRRMLDEISNPHRVAALTAAIAFKLDEISMERTLSRHHGVGAC
jgi:hypothetical protein